MENIYLAPGEVKVTYLTNWGGGGRIDPLHQEIAYCVINILHNFSNCFVFVDDF